MILETPKDTAPDGREYDAVNLELLQDAGVNEAGRAANVTRDDPQQPPKRRRSRRSP